MTAAKDIENTSTDEFIDDEDTIEQLLMDKETGSTSNPEEDEFAEDDLIESVETDSNSENEFAEIEELDAEEVITESMEHAAKENSQSADDSNDDFLIADFDISAEDDESSQENEETEIQNDPPEEDIQAENVEAETVQTETTQQNSETTSAVSPQDSGEKEQSGSSIDELNAQIAQLWAENENFKQQIAQLIDSSSSNENDSVAEEIENLSQEQRKLKKSIKESDAKVPVVTYVALGVGIIALILGGFLGAIGLGAQSDVTQLTELIATLEEEVDIVIAKDNGTDIKDLNTKINLLLAEDENLSKQLVETKNSLKSTPLKPVVDDLVEQNDRAQQAIDQLLAKVETLEKRKFVSASTKKPKKAKKVVAKVSWVVNLVSFKQQWYANRKAAEFEKKGIPVEVMKVKVNGQDWFRIRVKGFKSNYDAAAYAVKVKKTLNLSNVWVTKA